MGVQKNKKLNVKPSGKVKKAITIKKVKPQIEDYDSENFNYEDFNDKLQPQKWYQDFSDGILQTDVEIKFEELERLRKEAKSLLDMSVAMNNNKTPKSISASDYSWIKTILSKGTKSDKIAAYTLLIQDSPLHNLNFLNNIVGMIKVGKKEWTLAAETLQELFLNDLLPPGRKLILFSQRPLHNLCKISSGNESKRKNLLLYWFFENQLKLVYRDFIAALNAVAHDSVDANKEKAIMIMSKLLEKNPEQESALLSNIVNKLGDPSHKVGSKVIYVLTKLLQVHPNMRQVVMEEVEKLVFRPNISKRAQYYSICFLTQFCLTSEDSGLAKKLILIYLSIFKACIKMGDIDSRMMRALLTGVNRAYPFAKENCGILGEQINTIYKVVHIGKPNVSIQALSLLYLVSGESGSVSDRFYMVLYKKISEISLYNSTHHAMFLNLIYKTLKKDKSSDRIAAFLKRLLQVSLYLPPPLACGVLFIISEVKAEKKNIILLQQSVNDNSTMHKRFYDADESEDDGNEYYEDVPLEAKPKDEPSIKEKFNAAFGTPTVNHNPLLKDESQQKNPSEFKVWRNPQRAPEDKEKDSEYNPFCRNPLFSCGKQSVAVELRNLVHHYHPSVSLFANKILKGERINYTGDPLQDFALIRFLDKFSFKNPKKEKTTDTENETFNTFGKRKLYSQNIIRRLKVNTEKYLKQNERDVPPDEKFIYSYFKQKECTIQEAKDDDSDVDSVGSDEFQEMIHKMIGTKDDDDDIDFLNEAGQLAKKDKKLGKKEEEDSHDEGELSDEGSYAMDFEGSEIDDFSDELLEGSELDESEIPPELKHLNVNKKPQTDKKKWKSKDQFTKKNLFASAEEFAEILEETNYKGGGSEAISNRENADVKQLKWEAERIKKHKGNSFKSRNAKKSKPYGKSAPKAKKKNKKYL